MRRALPLLVLSVEVAGRLTPHTVKEVLEEVIKVHPGESDRSPAGLAGCACVPFL